MNESQVNALCVEASNGIDFDGITVVPKNSKFDVKIGHSTYENLTGNRLREVLSSHPRIVSNWDYWHSEPWTAPAAVFLRWLEGMRITSEQDPDSTFSSNYSHVSGMELDATWWPDQSHQPTIAMHGPDVQTRYTALSHGLTTKWGEVSISASLVQNGQRIYTVRHLDDQWAPTSALCRIDSIESLQSLVKKTADGRYRPLNSIPSLQDGWIYGPVPGHELIQIIDALYPLSIQHWYLAQLDQIEVDHFYETAERQSGIYEPIETISKTSLQFAVRACCSDSSCIKRRLWNSTKSSPINVPRGDGKIPCIAPCALFIEATRFWVSNEPDEPALLTDVDVAHAQAIAAAVQAGETDSGRLGDFSNPYNPYRINYLQAKIEYITQICAPLKEDYASK